MPNDYYQKMKVENVPAEVAEAIAAHEVEYAKIRDKVKSHHEKYKGTKYEEFPPILTEQWPFFVLRRTVEEERQRLTNLYGECPRHWALRVAWWKKHQEKLSNENNDQSKQKARE